MKNISTRCVNLIAEMDQAVNTIHQIERLTKYCCISTEDFEEPVWQEYDGSLYFDYKVYDINPERLLELGTLLGNAFGPAYINTTIAKGTNKYRGFVNIEIEVPIK